MSDKSDDLLKQLGKLKPNEMREIIENIAKQSGVATPTLAHLPNRLTAEDIIDRARVESDTFHWHIVDGDFDTMVDSRDALTAEEAVKFAYDPQEMQPWYSIHALDPEAKFENTSLAAQAKKVSSKEFRAWFRKD